MSAAKASTGKRLAELERRANAQDAAIGCLIETLARMSEAAGIDEPGTAGSRRDRLRLVRGDAS